MYWSVDNQAAIDKRLEWNNTPTTQEVRDTQEDLWVYQALLTIVRHLNDRADGHQPDADEQADRASGPPRGHAP